MAQLELEDWLQVLSTGVTLVIFALVAASYARRRTRRGLLLAVAFGLFLARGALGVAADLVGEVPLADTLESVAVPLELAFLALIALAFLRD